jgi:hypothetical protein
MKERVTVLEYATDFSGNENPLSEGGVWQNNGLDWTHVQKAGGAAYGTQSGSKGNDDSYAHLALTAAGWPADIELSGVVYMPSPIFVGTHEVELLVRWSDSPHVARGYEVSLSYGGEVQIIRWNGPLADFTPIGSIGIHPGLKDGDVFSATVVGPVIRGFVNGALIAQAVDSQFTDGSPGVGFFKRVLGNNSDFGFKNFTAIDV